SAEILKEYFNLSVIPAVGEGIDFEYQARTITLYRVPSSSRAYPKSITEKAIIYRKVWERVLG
ncbi:MAG: uracil-DNA glycosylase family protein, partial [Brevinema sp.]